MEKKVNRIFLLGFMGCGKSYIGKRLAQHLGYDFLDMDTFLEDKEGMTISQIFAEGGESLFRKLEQSYLHATQDFEQTIIDNGDGFAARRHGFCLCIVIPNRIEINDCFCWSAHSAKRPSRLQLQPKRLGVAVRYPLPHVLGKAR